MGQLGFNPMAMGFSPGSFPLESRGVIVGTAYDDPSARNWLSGGILSTSETQNMVGGVGITEAIPGALGTAGPRTELGSVVSRATTNAQLTGFSVFDQAHHGISVPGAPVPLYMPGMSVHFYRFGSNARLALRADPLLASIAGGSIAQNFSWDYVNSRLIPYLPAYAANVLTAASYNAGTGLVTATTTTAHGIPVGSDLQLSGIVPAAYNASYTTVAGTAGSTLVLKPLVPFIGNPGAVTTQGQLNAGGGGINIRVLDILVGNCMSPYLDPVLGTWGWNMNDTAAICII